MALTIPPPVLHRIGQVSRAPAAMAFERAARRPGDAQRARLRALMRAHAGTEYGRRFGFGDIRTPAQFAERVPLMSPDELQAYVARVMAGERNVLAAGEPLAYVGTTGSTGRAKFVPITPAYKAEFQRTVHVALWHLYRRFPQAFRGRALYFVGARRTERAPDGLDVGTMSGFNFTELPPLLRALYAWPYELGQVADLRTRQFLGLYLACLRDVTLVAGVFPAPIVYTLRALVERADELAFHLERGTLPDDLVLEPEQRAFFSRGLAPRPDLAARLRQIPRSPVEDAVRLAWPRLRLVYCWTTATAGLYVPELKRRLGPDVVVRDAIYSASEGWCSIPLGEEEPGGPVAVTSHYFEFVPEDDFERGGREAVPVEALEDGRRYYIVISNSAGVWRYLLGDLVEVCGRYRATPRIRFVRKAGATSNLCGEKLDEAHVNRAVGEALAALGLACTWFCLVAEPGGERPRYALHVEPAPGGAVSEALAAAVDERLGAHARDYEAFRRLGHLAPVRLVPVAPGAYDTWRQRQVAAGVAESQIKTVHLVDDPSRLPPEMAGE